MSASRRYRRRPDRPVIAIRLPLESDGLRYRKWGDTQTAKPGDWLVENEGDVYTIDAEVFERTYAEVGPGAYVKRARVWAERAEQDGSVETLEGRTHYRAGDYLVSDAPPSEDGEGGARYAISRERFEHLYEPDED